MLPGITRHTLPPAQIDALPPSRLGGYTPAPAAQAAPSGAAGRARAVFSGVAKAIAAQFGVAPLDVALGLQWMSRQGARFGVESGNMAFFDSADRDSELEGGSFILTGPNNGGVVAQSVYLGSSILGSCVRDLSIIANSGKAAGDVQRVALKIHGIRPGNAPIITFFQSDGPAFDLLAEIRRVEPTVVDLGGALILDSAVWIEVASILPEDETLSVSLFGSVGVPRRAQ